MKVKNHRLYLTDDNPVRFVASRNHSGSLSTHEYLVMHFTAGTSAESSINWLTSRDAGASAHLVIARDGNITQLVPFNKRAWHAGHSAWGPRVGLNSYSIGIELDNAGALTKTGSSWTAWSGQSIPDEEVIIATHKNGGEERGWHAYTQVQIEVAMEVATVLTKKYGLLDIVGHDDIAPTRKTDPGPAFPLESFRAHVIGRSETEEGRYRTTSRLNIRRGPGTDYEKLPGSPLPQGTEVLSLTNQGNWRFVNVLTSIPEFEDLEGWVHGAYLEPD